MTSTSGPSSKSADGFAARVEQVYRSDWGRLLSLLISRTRRLDLAEDALGEAFAQAVKRWPTDGVPSNPAGWLYTVAYRAIVGRLRAEAVAGRKQRLLVTKTEWTPLDESVVELADDRLELILLCCHPALPRHSQSALALRLVIGTPTAQIARLFLVTQSTMAARITRAKKKIVLTGIPLTSPTDDELAARLDEVCRTIYLAFTAGYAPGAGPDLLRVDEAGDAVRLALVLHQLAPDAPPAKALAALLLLQHSRRDTRELNGQLITLGKQDRSRWRHDEIERGLRLVSELEATSGYAEELRLQCLIAAEHACAATAETTDWSRISAHYEVLEDHTGSAIVRLNRAVAVAEADGPGAGLALLRQVEKQLPRNHRVVAVQAELARRCGDIDLARSSYQRAVDLCANDVERRYLTEQLTALDPS